jgi:hypothetical protein
MMGNHLKPSILFLDRHRLDYHGGNVAGVVTSVIAPTIVRDVEILQLDALKVQVHSFISLNKITPSHTTIVLSRSICFEHDIPFSGQYEDELGIQRFIDTVPFEHVGSKTIRMEKASRVVAANRDFYEFFQKEFQRHGFLVNAIVPVNLLNLPPTALANGLDLTVARLILDRVDSLSQLSLVATTPLSQEKTKNTPTHASHPNTRAIVLSLIFFILLIVLGFMVKNYINPTS